MPYLAKPKKNKVRQVNKEARQKIYQSTNWKKLRVSKLQQQPLCEMCLQKGIVTPAVDVHHLDSYLNYEGTERLYKAFNYSNLLSVCKQCHSYLHRYGTTHG